MFDFHLRGIVNGIGDEPRVRIFVMGINRMRDEGEFPPARAVPTKFYLSSARAASIESLNDGTLARQAAAALARESVKLLIVCSEDTS